MLRPKTVSERADAVRSFGEAMLLKLAQPKCANRTDWAEGDFQWFLRKLQEETSELVEGITAADLENIAEEAVDVANVALMIFDTATRRLRETASDSDLPLSPHSSSPLPSDDELVTLSEASSFPTTIGGTDA